LQVNHKGIKIFSSCFGYARNAAISGSDSLKWDTDTRQHVASVSKFFSAVLLLSLLDRKSISADELIKDYLPAH